MNFSWDDPDTPACLRWSDMEPEEEQAFWPRFAFWAAIWVLVGLLFIALFSLEIHG
jgi:hypothetical protein